MVRVKKFPSPVGNRVKLLSGIDNQNTVFNLLVHKALLFSHPLIQSLTKFSGFYEDNWGNNWSLVVASI